MPPMTHTPHPSNLIPPQHGLMLRAAIGNNFQMAEQSGGMGTYGNHSDAYQNGHEGQPLLTDMVVQVELESVVRQSLLSRCHSLSTLIEWLDSIDSRPGLSQLSQNLSMGEFNRAALKECIGYADAGYQRNIIKKTEFYELVAISWSAGQETLIHDHAGSDCAFRIVEGVSTETIYELDSEGLAVPLMSKTYRPGEACAAEEPDIHKISNDTESELINIHLYTPPLHAYNIYEAANQ